VRHRESFIGGDRLPLPHRETFPGGERFPAREGDENQLRAARYDPLSCDASNTGCP